MKEQWLFLVVVSKGDSAGGGSSILMEVN